MQKTVSITVTTDQLTQSQIEQAITAMFGRQSFDEISTATASSFRNCLIQYLSVPPEQRKPFLANTDDVNGELELQLENCVNYNGAYVNLFENNEGCEYFDDTSPLLSVLCGDDLKHLHGLAVLMLFGETIDENTRTKLLDGRLTVNFIYGNMVQEVFGDYPKFVQEVLSGHRHDHITCDVSKNYTET